MRLRHRHSSERYCFKKVSNKKRGLAFFLRLATVPPPFRHGAQIIWQIAKLILEFPDNCSLLHLILYVKRGSNFKTFILAWYYFGAISSVFVSGIWILDLVSFCSEIKKKFLCFYSK